MKSSKWGVMLRVTFSSTRLQRCSINASGRCFTGGFKKHKSFRGIHFLPYYHIPKIETGRSQLTQQKQQQQLKYYHHGDRKKNSSSMTSVQEVQQAILAMSRRTAELESLPPFWLQNPPLFAGQEKKRQEIFEGNRKLVQLISSAVERKTLNPFGKHGRDLSVLLGLAMQTYSKCATATSQSMRNSDVKSVFDECRAVLNLLESWNLALQSQHYKCAILAAVREQRFKEAADLFWQQIDPDCHPVDIDIASPVGLYAIARHSQEQNIPVAEQVLDAVDRMSMISPRDQEQYVLAAGTALGLSGEWRSSLEYLQNSYNASRFGQPLVCAVMHACLLCDRHEEALQVFDESLHGGDLTISAEFQWGGGEDRVSPLSRDLAMRAIGGCSQRELSSRAMKFFGQVEEDGMCISIEALEGVAHACERDRNWEDAVSVLFALLDHTQDPRWIVAGADLFIPEVEPAGFSSENMETVASQWLLRAAEILSSVMRACNSDGKFGVAVLCSRLFESYLPTSIVSFQQKSFEAVLLEMGQFRSKSFGNLERSLIPLIIGVENVNNILTATMVSLGGLGCSLQAVALFEALQRYLAILSRREQQDETEHNPSKEIDSSKIWPDAHGCYRRMLVEMEVDPILVGGKKWESSHRHIYRLTGALQSLRRQPKEMIVCSRQQHIIESALARAIRSCTFSEQPETGILLSEYVKKELSRFNDNNGNFLTSSATGSNVVGGLFSRFKEGSSSSATWLLRDEDKLLLSCDALFAATIEALEACKRSDLALDLFGSSVDLRDHGSLNDYALSCNSAVLIMSNENQTNDAMSLMNKITTSKIRKNTDTYTIAAKLYAKNEQWNVITDLYHIARTNGCLSGELSLLAMKSVTMLDLQGRLRILRGIIDDVATTSGISATKWMQLRYFFLKRELGFPHARRLMWWNDPQRSHLDELEFALEVFEKRKLAGLKPKNDIVRLIVANASKFDERTIPHREDRVGLLRVPFTESEWRKTLVRVLEEDSVLRNDANFIDQVVIALRNLNCERQCFEYVNDALSHGVRVRQTGLKEAYRASCKIGVHESSTSSLRLLLTD